MFTGIIEGSGTITGIRPSEEGRVLSVEAGFALDETKIGDSIAVNGACLTVVKLEKNRFQVDVAPETLSKTILGNAAIGDRVNLERALRLSGRLDGHLVSGHVDGTGVLKGRKHAGNAIIVTIGVSEEISSHMIKKGSVAVDGISLTINHCDRDSFNVSIIPHTVKMTTIGFKKTGDQVNIETDMIGKYVERFIKNMAGSDVDKKQSGIDMEFLARSGFL